MLLSAQMTIATFLIFSLLIPSLGEYSGVDLGSNQMQRLVDLLTVHECEELLMTLSDPEENICNQLHCMFEKTKQIRLSRKTRTTESHCHPALVNWLQTHGEQMYYDKLFHTLQQIGRTDIAIELAKNINQDKTMAMQRYVEEYHDQVNKVASHLMQSQTKKRSQKETHHFAKQVRSLSWKDLDLVVEWQPIPPYKHHMLDGAWPLFIGLIFGVGGSLILGMLLLLFILSLTL